MAPKRPVDSATEEVRKAIAPAMQKFGPEYWREQDEAKTFPTEFFETMGSAGYFGTFIPEAYGGADAGARVASVLVEEINRAGGDASSVNAQMAICRTLVLHGTEEQKQRYLPGVASGEILRQLMERDLVRISGRSEELGRPYVYATTKRFLRVFGLGSLDELPRAHILTGPSTGTEGVLEPERSATYRSEDDA